MGQSKNERMLELVELLNKASRSYYQDAKEIMSNYEYGTLIRPFRVIADEGNYNDNFNILVSRLCSQCQQLFSSPHIHTKSTADKKSTDKFLVMEYPKLLQETFF